MKILVETSALVSISVYWKDPTSDIELKHDFFDKCQQLFDFLKQNSEVGIITKTVENEAQGVMNGSVSKAIRQSYFPDFNKKRKIMILQDVIISDCIYRLEKVVVECSSRLPIDTDEREKILKREIEPTLKEIVRTSLRYIQPPIPRFIKGTEARSELTKMMLSYHREGTIYNVYKGMPSPKDLLIMAEATMITRKFGVTEKIYVASCDYHFIPNRIQIGSYRSGYMTYLDELIPDVKDSAVRDRLSKNFGFIGEDPAKLMEILTVRNSGTS